MFTTANLTIIDTVTVNHNDMSFELAIIDDGQFAHVYDSSDLDADVEYSDYNDFCQRVRAHSNEAIIAKAAAAAGLDGAYTAGDCRWVEAAE